MNLSQLNDYELLYLIKRKNNEALELLINKYKILIYYKVKFFTKDSKVYDDVVQDCLLSLIDAIDKFDENMNVMFSSYISIIIRRKLVRIFNGYYKEKELITELKNMLKLETVRETDVYCDRFIENINDEHILHEIRNELNEFQIIIFNRIFLNNESIIDVSEDCNCNVKKIYNNIQAIKKIYKKKTLQ